MNKTYETQDGVVEVLDIITSKTIIVRFVDTGFETVTSKTKLQNGTVVDNTKLLTKAKEGAADCKYKVELHTGEIFYSPSQTAIAYRLNISEPMVRSVFIGRANSRLIKSVELA